jgi:thiamine transporter
MDWFSQILGAIGQWFQDAFAKFAEIPLWAIIVVALLLAGSVVGLVLYVRKQKKDPQAVKPKKGWDTKTLIVGALCVSLAFVLSYIRIVHMPQAGSVTLASMLPIMAFAYIYGTPKGLVVGLIYGLLQMLQDMYIVHWAQAIMDYVLAFMALAAAGLFKKSIVPGVIVGGVLRYIFHVVSGQIFFASYAPAQDFMSVLWYSLGYNSVVLIEVAIILVVVIAVPQLRRFFDSQKALATVRVGSPT